MKINMLAVYGWDGAAANDDDDEEEDDADEYKYDDSISTSITTAAGDVNNVDYDKKNVYIYCNEIKKSSSSK